MDTFVLTGSTGSFGKFLARELLKHEQIKLILLIRAATQVEAEARAQKVIGPGTYEVRMADLTKENFGLTDDGFKKLAEQTAYILHSAASTRFNLPLAESRLHNVEITKRMIEFARECPKLIRLGYVSTAFVSGKRSGLILEDEFKHNAGFSNSYQQSKYEAETLMREEVGRLPVAVFRPPFIISPSNIEAGTKGASKDFLTMLVSLVASGKLSHVPGTPQSRMDLIKAEDAAKAICALMTKDRLEHLSYHITNGDLALPIAELQEQIESMSGKKIAMEYCGDLDTLKKKISTNHELQTIYEKAGSFLYEPAYSKIFDNRNTLSELGLGELGIKPSEILKNLFKEKTWNISE